MKTNWLTQALEVAVERGYPIALLSRPVRTDTGVTFDAIIRVYERNGSTKFTFHLSDFAPSIQDAAIDTIMPVI